MGCSESTQSQRGRIILIAEMEGFDSGDECVEFLVKIYSLTKFELSEG